LYENSLQYIINNFINIKFNSQEKKNSIPGITALAEKFYSRFIFFIIPLFSSKVEKIRDRFLLPLQKSNKNGIISVTDKTCRINNRINRVFHCKTKAVKR